MKILIVAAHPDDEILGCGGTVAKLINSGALGYTLILGEGVTSRDLVRDREKREKELKNLKDNIYKANSIIGINDVDIYDFPDNRFDSVPLLDIVKVIEKVKNKVKPDIIFTHYENDLNIDHRITYNGVITSTRPQRDESVKKIFSFEILSSTEWKYPISFSPDTFVEINDTINLKIDAMKKYTSEICEFPHPRSEKGIRTLSEFRGMNSNLKNAEAFKTVRSIINGESCI